MRRRAIDLPICCCWPGSGRACGLRHFLRSPRGRYRGPCSKDEDRHGATVEGSTYGFVHISALWEERCMFGNSKLEPDAVAEGDAEEEDAIEAIARRAPGCTCPIAIVQDDAKTDEGLQSAAERLPSEDR